MLLLVASATGCCRGELLALTWPDINFTSGMMAVAPLSVGAMLEILLADNAAPLRVYRGLFIGLALLQAAVFLPLRGFGR